MDQIWAEALERYHNGEELYLKGRVAADAYVMQQDAMESDDREGVIAEYLEMLLPANWDRMDLYQRRRERYAGRRSASWRSGVSALEKSART